jgi:glycosyltransferase involved in cell wall biosynthesis
MILGAMPAFNEEKYIAKTILGVRRHVDEVLVVDDGSTDATGEIATALGAHVIKHPSNGGYGRALQTIFKAAQELDADALVVIDSDGQHNPEDIPRLLGVLQNGTDIVIGSRFLEGMDSFIPAYRKMGMKVLDTATQFAGTIKVTDSQSGFRAYNRKAIKAIRINGNGMSAGSEILVQIGVHHLQVAEVPIMVDYAREDTSTHNPFSSAYSSL